MAGAEEVPLLIRNPYIFPNERWEEDWRAFENATVVTDVKAGLGQVRLPKGYQYSEGLDSCKLKDGVQLQSTHVAVHEGHPGQHLIYRYSKDNGTTWSEWKDVEPDGPPMSPYGGFVQHPATRRTYFVYTLGYDKVVPDLPNGKPYSGKAHPHHIGQAAFRLVHDDGTMDKQRHIMRLPQTAIDRQNVYEGKHCFFYNSPRPTLLMGDDGIGWYTKLGPRPLVSEGAAFLVVFKEWAKNDRLEDLDIQLLPEGDGGIHDPESACIAEFAPVHLDGRHFYFKYRTTAGYAGLAESHDGGRTFITGPMRYALDNQPVKNPQGPLRTFTDAAGRIWLTWYNMGYRKDLTFDGRDMVFIAPICIADGALRVGQGELATYRKDQKGWSGDLRMNCLSFKERQADSWLSQTSNKYGLRTMRVPEAYAGFVANQFDHQGIPAHGMVLDLPEPAETVAAPDLNAAMGATLMFSIPTGLPAGNVLLDGMDDKGAGVRIKVGEKRDITFSFGDGKQKAELPSDPDALSGDTQRHHIAVILDGHAGLASMVINGRMQDGGKHNLRGVIWFSHEMRSISGYSPWRVHQALKDMRVYARVLLTTEAIGAWRESAR